MAFRGGLNGMALGALWLFGLAAEGGAQTVELVSRVDPGRVSTTPAGNSFAPRRPSLSADGRFVVFVSDAANVAPGVADANGVEDVFLFDRWSGGVALVSHAAADATRAGRFESNQAVISADGNWVAFESRADDLVAGQTDDTSSTDVFLWERATNALTLASHRAGRPLVAAGTTSLLAGASVDGATVVFVSLAPDLVAGQIDSPGNWDVFAFERSTGASTLVSGAAAAPLQARGGLDAALDATGRFVTFSSEGTDVAPGQSGPATRNAFLHDRQTGLTTLVSHTPAGTSASGNDASFEPVLSADGDWVAFVSAATDLTPDTDANGRADVFLFARVGGAVTLLSRAAGGAPHSANGRSFAPALAGDGRRIAFVSDATDLVGGQIDTNAKSDVFAYDRQTGALTLVSRRRGTTQQAGDDASRAPYVSADGTRIVFVGEASDLAPGVSDTTGTTDVFVFEPDGAQTRLVSRKNTEARGASSIFGASADAAWLALSSGAADLVPGDANAAGDAFLTGDAGDSFALVSRRDPARPSATAPGLSRLLSGQPLQASGRAVVFFGADPAQTPAAAGGGVLVADRHAHVTLLAPHRAGDPARPPNGDVSEPSLSADGRFMAFASDAPDVVAGQGGPVTVAQIFLLDRANDTVELVSHRFDSLTTGGNHNAGAPVIGADGRFVAFESLATDLVSGQVDVPATPDVFLYDRLDRSVRLVSRAAGTTATAASGASLAPRLSADGRFVAFTSGAGDLVPGQSGVGGAQVFVFDRATGQCVLASHAFTSALQTANEPAGSAAISADGGVVVFGSRAGDLVAGFIDNNDIGGDVFAWERATGTVALMSGRYGSSTQSAHSGTSPLALSADGRFVLMVSRAFDLVPRQSDPNGGEDLFLRDRTGGAGILVSHRAGSPAATGNAPARESSMTPDGRFVAFSSSATDLIAGQSDANGTSDVFLFDRMGGSVALASHVAGGAETTANGPSGSPYLAADGDTLVFTSSADNLAPLDFNRASDVFAFVQSRPLRGDFDRDRLTDLLWRETATGALRVWAMEEGARTGESTLTPDLPGPEWSVGGVADFDGDGLQDLVLRHDPSGATEFWRLDAAGARIGDPLPLSDTPPPNWRLVATADFNGDRHTDLLWLDVDSRQLVAWTLAGTTHVGSLVPNPAQAADANWQVVAAVDTNADTFPDLVWHNVASGRVVYWLMDAALQRLAGQFTTPTGAGDAHWRVVAAGDFGVGPAGWPVTTDLVWRNATSGRVVLWHMDVAGRRTAGRFTTPEAPSDPLAWEIAGPR